MYNRYIPQPDGSYRRNQMPLPQQEPERPKSVPPPPQNPPPQPNSCGYCPNRQPQRPTVSRNPRPPVRNTGVLTFLKQLLPKDFDAEDLLVILLLLLMAGDCQEGQNSALLTLAIYLFV